MLESFATVLIPLLSLMIEPQDNSNSTCIHQDFSQQCINRGQSFYMNGLCYQLQTFGGSPYPKGSTYSNAQENCLSKGMRLATLRNVDLASMFMTFFTIFVQNRADIYNSFWIDETNDTLTTFTSLDGLTTTDGTVTLLNWNDKRCLDLYSTTPYNLNIENLACHLGCHYYCESNISQEQCQLQQNAFYMDNICFHLQMTKDKPAEASYADAEQHCLSIGMRLSTVRSVDFALQAMRLYRNITKSMALVTLWIETPPDHVHAYRLLDGTQNEDGFATMSVTECNLCSEVARLNSSHLVLDRRACCNLAPFSYCESGFTEKPCMVTEGMSDVCFTQTQMATSDLSECMQQCLSTTWCNGIQFNNENGTCQVLYGNLTMSNVECDITWLYYERT